MPTISPRAPRTRRPARPARPRSSSTWRSSTCEQRLAGLGGLLLDAQEHLAPDHQLRELLLRSRPRAGQRVDRLAAPQDRDPVGDLEHLVQLVADEDDRHALARERAQDLEQLARLLRRQHRRRLVEDQDVRAAVERLQDLDPLLLADADVLDPRVRVDGELERPRRSARRAPRRRPGRGRPLARRLDRRARCSRPRSSPGSA